MKKLYKNSLKIFKYIFLIKQNQLQNEQTRLNNEMDSLKSQLDNYNKDKV